MDWTDIVTTILAALTGGGSGVLIKLWWDRRRIEAEAYRLRADGEATLVGAAGTLADRLLARLDAVERRLEEREREVQDLRAELERARAEIEDLRRELERAEGEIQTLRARVTNGGPDAAAGAQH